MAKTIKAERLSKPTRDVLPVLVVIVDKNLAIRELNGAARQFLGPQYKKALHKRNGEAFACIHSHDAPAGCGHGRFCSICPIREAATLAWQEQRVVRRRTKAQIGSDEQRRDVNLLVTATPLPSQKSARILLMLEDVTALAALQTSAPVCASCKRIRDDRAYWEQLCAHLNEQLDLDLTDGVCTKCRQQLYRGLKESQPLFFKEPAGLSRHR